MNEKRGELKRKNVAPEYQYGNLKKYCTEIHWVYEFLNTPGLDSL